MAWYRKAAAHDDARALNNLGVKLEFGHGCEKNEVEAVKCYRRAAELGSIWGMYNYADMLEDGRGPLQR